MKRNPQPILNSEFNTFWTICKELVVSTWELYRTTVRDKITRIRED